MFKKRDAKASGFRRREKRKSVDEDDGVVVSKKATVAKRGTVFSTKGEEVESDEDEEKTGAVFASNRSATRIEHRGGAFEMSEVDAAASSDARALLEKKLKMQAEGKTNDETYRGAAAYRSYVKIQESQIGGNKYTGTKGPIRAPQFVRNTCRFDYQPDVCKDYKDTGFCGYGDSCKFLHDRGDFKTGWQMEAEYKQQKQREKEREMLGKLGGEDSDEERERNKFRIEDDGDDGIPFACHLCRGPFKDPMQTLCGHYFCASCAQAHFRDRKGQSLCPVCAKQTHGVLNPAPKLRTKAKSAGGFDKLFESYRPPPSPPPQSGDNATAVKDRRFQVVVAGADRR